MGNTRGGTRTDDRGMYELPNLAPGEYRLSVRAQPWYAANSQGIRGNDSDAAALDPSLDFAYPADMVSRVSAILRLRRRSFCMRAIRVRLTFIWFRYRRFTCGS